MSSFSNKCYSCIYRRNVPGDSHSACGYPGTDYNNWARMITGNPTMAHKLNIRADEYGVKSGWFLWPVNFDPAWLMNCNGYTTKAEE